MRSACNKCTKVRQGQSASIIVYFRLIVRISSGDGCQLTIMAWMPELTKTNIQIGGDM